MKRAWTTFDANHIKGDYSWIIFFFGWYFKSLATYYTYMGFIAKMRTCFLKLLGILQNRWQRKRTVCFKAGKGYERRGTDYRYEWKGSETEGILYTVYSMAQQFHEHKMDVIKNGSLNEKQKKNLSMLMGIS
jgi:hypothetical protein